MYVIQYENVGNYFHSFENTREGLIGIRITHDTDNKEQAKVFKTKAQAQRYVDQLPKKSKIVKL